MRRDTGRLEDSATGGTSRVLFRDVPGPRELEDWRATARALVRDGVTPGRIRWVDPDDAQGLLPVAAGGDGPGEARVDSRAGANRADLGANARAAAGLRVPAAYVRLCELALCHVDPARWDVMYRVLWRMAHGEARLMADASDGDVHALMMLAKAVKRDAHKMKAFVRFRLVRAGGNGAAGGEGETSDERAAGKGGEGAEHYIAWHRPDHRIVRLVAPFFARRFGVMRWTILTPVGSAAWDGRALTYGPAATSREAPTDDALESMWRTYYANIFNPARVNVAAMQREMPVRYWGTLPEAAIIDELLRSAPKRVGRMMESSVGIDQGARAYMPAGKVTLPVLREAAAGCRGCGLCERATQVVFGEGPADARVMLIGEQPGDQEDVQGRPFVGPAGEVLDRALAAAGLARERMYITNAVKHFKWTPDPRGKRRLHARPSALEARACRAWLEEELRLVRPGVVVLLGATAGQSLFGASFRVSAMRGRVMRETTLSPAVCVATLHPSAILRAPDEAMRERSFAMLVEDLRMAGEVGNRSEAATDGPDVPR